MILAVTEHLKDLPNTGWGVVAMVAGGQGWTILPPLALHHGPRFQGGLTVAPLPFQPLSRRLSLIAREGVLRDVPAQITAHLRGLISARVIAPALAEWPWLQGHLRLD
jgi:DNA-binding transcriptional LysR family regulator